MKSDEEQIIWHDVREWDIEGKGFEDTESYFDRLPSRAKGIVPTPVWDLSHHSAGMSVRFETNSTEIHVRYALTGASLAMNHMAATGVSGLDLYANDGNTWRWLATYQPTSPEPTGILRSGIDPGQRQYQINLPLYNGVKSLEIGLPRDAIFQPIPPRQQKPIVFYGTSITQGACASRPGMCYTNILGRQLNQPTINLGFSGSARMEIELANFLAELDPAIFVIECMPNMNAAQISERTIPFIQLIHRSHPSTPILLLEGRRRTDAWIIGQIRRDDEHKHDNLRKAYQELLSQGIPHLHFRAGDDVLGHDDEGTVDGSHPNDLGMMRYAQALEPELRRILASAK